MENRNSNAMKFGDVVTLFNDKVQGWITCGDQIVGSGLWLPKLRTKLDVPPRFVKTKVDFKEQHNKDLIRC